MVKYPYHNYLFFKVGADFYQLPKADQQELKDEFEKFLSSTKNLLVDQYTTLGLKANTTFVLWVRGRTPGEVQIMLRGLLRTKLGKYLSITYTYFGIERQSEYSRGHKNGKSSANPDQVMQDKGDRLPFLVLYPFTKTSDWHVLDFENRRSIMGQHIKVGLGHPKIRQCLLYSYGIDDQEFIISYEMNKLEEFQDLVIEMRRTIGRKYTLSDTPTFTCIYRSPKDLMKWL